jgi:protein-tyrosine-phosphatase/DNA-binding HxlR family transcriptional regulator
MDMEQVAARAAVHASLGDPSRLAVALALQGSDRSPSWLTAELGVPSNLLAHHTNVLERAGVVERVRSTADRRKTYLRLTEAGRRMLGHGEPVDAPRVLFVCTHNSARSQFAEALWRRRSRVPACSAGTRPADEVNPMAVSVAQRRGLDLHGARPRALEGSQLGSALVVTVCDDADQRLDSAHLHWSVPDPAATGRRSDFVAAFEQIAERVDQLAEAVGTPA